MKRPAAVPAPIVTDHALVRYLERVVGIDVEAHRREVAALVGVAVAHRAGALVHDGHRYCLSDAFVTTVKPVRRDPAFPVVRAIEDAE